MTLLDLQEGESGIITKVKGRGAFRKRIMEMGFVIGKNVTVGKKAPLKNPIEYTLMGYNVSLRNSEADLIEVVKSSRATEDRDTKFNGFFESTDQRSEKKVRSKKINIALIGNPNSGKTTLFNFASHSREKVGNYSGVTVKAKKAKFKQHGYEFHVIDLPGTYSLTSYSPEELFVRNYLFDEIPDVVINVIDASNLERNLYLTTQLIDMDIKVVAALNMYDELQAKGDKFDYEALGKMIGVPMIPVVSSKGRGIQALFEKVVEVYEDRDSTIRHIHINYGEDLELAIKNIQDKIRIEENKKLTNVIAPRFLAIKLLEGDREEEIRVRSCINHRDILQTVSLEKHRIREHFTDDPESIITDQKYGFVHGALKETFKPSQKNIRLLSRSIDRILTNKYLSYPVFIFMMWLMFQSTFTLGEYPKIGIENLIRYLGQLTYNALPDNVLRDLLVDGIIGGVGGVIVFLPNILILFFFISIMEDTGYMARVAFIVDKLMHKVGLHGQSFIPMLMGFGCNVTAIMATRTIKGRNDRLVTMLINPFMSCSARLPVYVLIIGAIFPTYPGLVLFSIYAIGIILAIVIAIIFKKTLFKAKEMPFVMELPPYRIPTVKSILRHTWFKGSQYLKKMSGVILIASIVIWALGYFPRNQIIADKYNQEIKTVEKQFDILISNAELQKIKDSLVLVKSKTKQQILNKKNNELQERSAIGMIGKFIEPVIYPLGFDWRMGISLLSGIAAKEVVVSTMGVIFLDDSGDLSEQSLSEILKEQRYQSGFRKGDKIFTPLTAYSFLLFILIYFPCIAVIAAIKKEAGGWKWALFMAFYSTALAWTVSFLVFQIGSLFS